ncbi:MAG: hypothetical protein KQH83_06030 [Actinobacteria bacterium]|nr:hypothetical protein [Actinomycetota bacterium]
MDVLVAAAIGAAILLLGWFGIRVLRTAPPEAGAGGVVEVSADYRCTVCGMRLTVTHAGGEEIDPPRHCHEPMEEAP